MKSAPRDTRSRSAVARPWIAAVLAALGAAAAIVPGGAPAADPEIRALWVDAFHAGIKTPAETARLVEEAREGNFNAIVVQVRKRGDAYYESAFEPKASDVSPQRYDPLADLIARAHEGPEPLQVHAWIVAFNIWNYESSPPPQADHPFRLHPEWVTTDAQGRQWDGANFQFDPALPAVQEHTFAVVMDLVTRYEVDGIHFDYIRYSEAGSSAGANVWGYHPEAVARFNALRGRAGIPAPDDPQWLDFRRDQVTALMRKTWLSVTALRPEVCISAACITWGNAPTSATQASFRYTEAYRRVLQDWRGWLDEGILDLAIPMIYRRFDTASGARGFDDWTRRAKEYQDLGRHAAIGVAFYLNSIGDNLVQMRKARDTGPFGAPPAAGSVGYSYAVPADTGESRDTLLAALTDPAAAEAFTPGAAPLFADPAPVPAMPWKDDANAGHLMGTLTEGRNRAPVDGAVITLSGPASRTLTSDGTGFFGAVGLPPGRYTLTATPPDGGAEAWRTVVVAGGEVAALDIVLDPDPEPFGLEGFAALADPHRAVITWRSRAGHEYAVEASAGDGRWTTLATGIPAADDGRNTFQDTPPPDTRRRFYRIVERRATASP